MTTIYLVSAPGHENTGYGDGLIDGQHPKLLVSFLEYSGKLKPVAGFAHSGKNPQPEPLLDSTESIAL